MPGKAGRSLMNLQEAEVALGLVQRLCNANRDIDFGGRIGVITPYRQQKRLLQKELASRFGPKSLQAVEISTVVVQVRLLRR